MASSVINPSGSAAVVKNVSEQRHRRPQEETEMLRWNGRLE